MTCAGCVGARPAAPGPRVLLVTLDTTRTDHLTPYGYARDTSPGFASLAARGVLFTRAYCNMPTTDPSHASILTGLYPRRHGITRNGQRGVEGLPSLAERLRARGLRTAAFLSRKHLDPRQMGVPGFERVDLPAEKERTAEGTAGAAIEWLRRQEDGGYFLWVHLFDAHSPYTPPAPFHARFGAGPGERRLGKMGWLNEGVSHDPSTASNNIRLYDGEIAYADQWLGRLVETAESLPGAPPLIVVVADHGESLDDLEDRFRYAYAHGEFLYDHQTRVPLVLAWKGRLPEGRKVGALVESVDLAPTLLDLLGESLPANGSGVSRSALLRGEEERGAEAVFVQRRSFAVPEQPWLDAPEFAVVKGALKLIVNVKKGVELYDLDMDPAERNNLAGARPADVRSLNETLVAWLRANPSASASEEATDEKLEDLKSLGYVN